MEIVIRLILIQLNHLWSNPYVGAFYKDDESGERIISGNKWSYWYQWRVEVPTEYQDFIVISSTPSFDPNVGTGSPGDPEDYPVIPNSQKGETGQFCTRKRTCLLPDRIEEQES